MKALAAANVARLWHKVRHKSSERDRTARWAQYWSQSNGVNPCSETVFDGHTCSSLSFLPASEEAGDLGEGATSPPSPRKFVACVRHGLKNTRVALAELTTASGSSVCSSNSSGGR